MRQKHWSAVMEWSPTDTAAVQMLLYWSGSEMGIYIQQCQSCLTHHYPNALMCSECHSRDFMTDEIEHGVVEECTVQRGFPDLAFDSVSVVRDRVDVARTEGEAVRGERLTLAQQGRAGETPFRLASLNTCIRMDD